MINLNTGINGNLMNEIVELAKKHQIEKVVLFGSRARGDYKIVSDIDLAISGGNVVEFTLDAEDYINTLLKFDVVNLDGAVQDELIQMIKKEGIVIYEKI